MGQRIAMKNFSSEIVHNRCNMWLEARPQIFLFVFERKLVKPLTLKKFRLHCILGSRNYLHRLILDHVMVRKIKKMLQCTQTLSLTERD